MLLCIQNEFAAIEAVLATVYVTGVPAGIATVTGSARPVTLPSLAVMMYPALTDDRLPPPTLVHVTNCVAVTAWQAIV